MFKEEMQEPPSFISRIVSTISPGHLVHAPVIHKWMFSRHTRRDISVSRACFKTRPHRDDAAARDEIDRHVPERRHGGEKGGSSSSFVSLLVFIPRWRNHRDDTQRSRRDERRRGRQRGENITGVKGKRDRKGDTKRSGGRYNAAARQTRVALDTVLDRDRRLCPPLPNVRSSLFRPFILIYSRVFPKTPPTRLRSRIRCLGHVSGKNYAHERIVRIRTMHAACERKRVRER